MLSIKSSFTLSLKYFLKIHFTNLKSSIENIYFNYSRIAHCSHTCRKNVANRTAVLQVSNQEQDGERPVAVRVNHDDDSANNPKAAIGAVGVLRRGAEEQPFCEGRLHSRERGELPAADVQLHSGLFEMIQLYFLTYLYICGMSCIVLSICVSISHAHSCRPIPDLVCLFV